MSESLDSTQLGPIGPLVPYVRSSLMNQADP